MHAQDSNLYPSDLQSNAYPLHQFGTFKILAKICEHILEYALPVSPDEILIIGNFLWKVVNRFTDFTAKLNDKVAKTFIRMHEPTPLRDGART